MAMKSPTPEQLNSALTPARAREVLAKQKFGADLDRYLTPEEAKAVQLLFQADVSGAITRRAVVARIAACEAQFYPLPRSLVLFNAMNLSQRKCAAQECGSQELPAILAHIEVDPDAYAELTGLDLGSGLPLWRITVAADVTRYGAVERRAATLREALASITTDVLDETPMENSDGLFGYRIVDAGRYDDAAACAANDPTEHHSLDRPLGGLEVYVRHVGHIGALEAIVHDLLAFDGQAFSAAELQGLIASAQQRLAPFVPAGAVGEVA